MFILTPNNQTNGRISAAPRFVSAFLRVMEDAHLSLNLGGFDRKTRHKCGIGFQDVKTAVCLSDSET